VLQSGVKCLSFAQSLSRTILRFTIKFQVQKQIVLDALARWISAQRATGDDILRLVIALLRQKQNPLINLFGTLGSWYTWWGRKENRANEMVTIAFKRENLSRNANIAWSRKSRSNMTCKLSNATRDLFGTLGSWYTWWGRRKNVAN
jgi:hypothetical protein